MKTRNPSDVAEFWNPIRELLQLLKPLPDIFDMETIVADCKNCLNYTLGRCPRHKDK